MPKPSDDDIDRLLAEGARSVSSRDRMFDSVMARVDASDAQNASSPSRESSGAPTPGWRHAWQRLWRPLAVFAPVAAIAVVVVQQLSTPGLQALGDEYTAFLEASCGAADAPCRVGESIFLRLRSSHALPYVQVALVSLSQKTVIAEERDLNENSGRALPVKLTADAADVQSGVTLVVADAGGRTLSTLHLNVVGALP